MSSLVDRGVAEKEGVLWKRCSVESFSTEGKMDCIDLNGTKRPSSIQQTILGSTGPGRSPGEWATLIGLDHEEDDGLNGLALCSPPWVEIYHNTEVQSHFVQETREPSG